MLRVFSGTTLRFAESRFSVLYRIGVRRDRQKRYTLGHISKRSHAVPIDGRPLCKQHSVSAPLAVDQAEFPNVLCPLLAGLRPYRVHWSRGSKVPETGTGSVEFGRQRPVPVASDLRMLRDLQRVVHLHPEIAQGRFQLRVPEKELDRSEILRPAVDQGRL